MINKMNKLYSVLLILSLCICNIKADECSDCIALMDDNISELTQIIANMPSSGITCEDVCSQLPNQLYYTLCEIICDSVGISAFQSVINEVPPGPTEACVELELCEETK